MSLSGELNNGFAIFSPPTCTCVWDNVLARQLFGFFSFSLRVLFAILNLVDMQSYSGRLEGVHMPKHTTGIKAGRLLLPQT